MNVLDIGVVLILIMFAIVGFKHGVVRELVSFLGIIIVFILAFLLRRVVGNFLCIVFPFFKFSGSIEGISALNILLYQALAFILVFAILLSLYAIILKLSRVLQKIVNWTIILWLPSKLLGIVVGLVEGYIVLFLILVVLIIPFGGGELYESSKFAPKIIYDTPVLSDSARNITTSTREVYNLVSDVSLKKIDSNEANIKTIDILLKHNVVSKDLVVDLINNGKLTNVYRVEKVLNNY